MLAIFAAIASGLCFTLLSILLKRNTSAGANPLILPSWLAMLFPVWCLIFIVSHATGTLTYNITPTNLMWPLLWAACTVTTTTILVWLLQSLSLTEVAGYKKALLTILASGADIFIFQTTFPLATVLAIAFILFGSIGLGQARHQLPSPIQAAAIISWCLIITLQVTAYKQGQLFQSSVLAHTVIAQSFSTGLYSLLWALPSIQRTPFPALGKITPLLAVAMLGVLMEGFAYAGLPIAVVIILTMSGAALFAVHDLWHRDLPRTPRTYLALTAITLGFLLLVVPH